MHNPLYRLRPVCKASFLGLSSSRGLTRPLSAVIPSKMAPVCTENLIRVDGVEIGYPGGMIALISFVLAILASPFKSKSWLEAENAALRQQLIVLRRKVKGRARLTNTDRWFFVRLYRWFPSILEVVCSEN